jgi:hypothetical protein
MSAEAYITFADLAESREFKEFFNIVSALTGINIALVDRTRSSFCTAVPPRTLSVSIFSLVRRAERHANGVIKSMFCLLLVRGRDFFMVVTPASLTLWFPSV